MVILMILEGEFPPDLRVENEISALIEAGNEVHLMCSTRKNLPVEDRLNKAFIHRYPISTFIHKSSIGCLNFPFYFNFWRKHLYNLFKKYKYDVIHVHDLPLSRLGVELKREYGIPLVLDLHENWPGLLKHALHTQTIIGRHVFSYERWTRYEKDMLHEADLVITVVEEAKDRIASLGIKKGKLFIVSNSANIKNIPSYQRKRTGNDFILFYGGGINWHRGLQIVLDAIKILEERNISIGLEVAGSGSYMETLKKKSIKLGIASDVVFHGQKPFNEMMELLAEADAAIIPHLRTENNDATIPHKLFQYMYLNIPIISSDCLPLERIITETDTGFIYKNDSPVALASLLEKLYNDRTFLKDKGVNGRKAVLAKYNWNFDKEILVKAYDTLDKKKQKGYYHE
jgi:glycosyltransferase involved in cell wall biosynthesis